MTTTGKAKRTDRRVIRTRKAIMNAFDKLICDGDIGKISISAIAREANIDRKTFYLHYRSVDDLASYKVETALERILTVRNEQGAGKPMAQRLHIVLQEVNSILTENLTMYEHIASRISTKQALAYFDQASQSALANIGLNPSSMTNQQVRMRLQFYIAGAISLYSTWLQSSRTQPIEEISGAIESAVFTSLAELGIQDNRTADTD